jgi:ABC-type Fe3+/spermidine/putrescine transport system ATPase subunit
MVFQNYALFPHMTVFDNIAYPLRMRRIPRREVRKRVREALDLIQLPELGRRYPRQLSGGQQQRIAVARALVYEPRVLLMDEPLGALDRKLREQMQIELRNLQQSLGTTTLYVTHDQEEAMALSDRVVVMRQGQIEQVGSPDDLYERPQTRFVADFIGESNCLEGRILAEGDSSVFELKEGLQVPIARPQAAALQEEVRLVIRPERIRWADNGKTEVAMTGIVEAVTYLGERIRYLIRLEGGQKLAVTHPNLQSVRRLTPGATVKVGWNHADVAIL